MPCRSCGALCACGAACICGLECSPGTHLGGGKFNLAELRPPSQLPLQQHEKIQAGAPRSQGHQGQEQLLPSIEFLLPAARYAAADAAARDGRTSSPPSPSHRADENQQSQAHETRSCCGGKTAAAGSSSASTIPSPSTPSATASCGCAGGKTEEENTATKTWRRQPRSRDEMIRIVRIHQELSRVPDGGVDLASCDVRIQKMHEWCDEYVSPNPVALATFGSGPAGVAGFKQFIKVAMANSGSLADYELSEITDDSISFFSSESMNGSQPLRHLIRFTFDQNGLITEMMAAPAPPQRTPSPPIVVRDGGGATASSSASKSAVTLSAQTKALLDSQIQEKRAHLGDICRSAPGPAVATHVAQSLRGNKLLTELDLTDCGVGTAGVRALATALTHDNDTLESLILDHNEIGDFGAEDLADMLRHNTSLRRLSLGSCAIGGELGLRALLRGLEENETLQLLQLGGLALSEAKLEDMAGLLRRHNSHTAIELDAHAGTAWRFIQEASAENTAAAFEAERRARCLLFCCSSLSSVADRSPVTTVGAIPLHVFRPAVQHSAQLLIAQRFILAAQQQRAADDRLTRKIGSDEDDFEDGRVSKRAKSDSS